MVAPVLQPGVDEVRAAAVSVLCYSLVRPLFLCCVFCTFAVGCWWCTHVCVYACPARMRVVLLLLVAVLL